MLIVNTRGLWGGDGCMCVVYNQCAIIYEFHEPKLPIKSNGRINWLELFLRMPTFVAHRNSKQKFMIIMLFLRCSIVTVIFAIFANKQLATMKNHSEKLPTFIKFYYTNCMRYGGWWCPTSYPPPIRYSPLAVRRHLFGEMQKTYECNCTFNFTFKRFCYIVWLY